MQFTQCTRDFCVKQINRVPRKNNVIFLNIFIPAYGMFVFAPMNGIIVSCSKREHSSASDPLSLSLFSRHHWITFTFTPCRILQQESGENTPPRAIHRLPPTFSGSVSRENSRDSGRLVLPKYKETAFLLNEAFSGL